MPSLPQDYSSSSLVSPTSLNTSLYSFFEANPFYPTGVQWHARKPVYKSVAAGTVSVGSGVTGYPFTGQGSANIIEDSCADYGNPLDPPQWGTVQSEVPGADGSFTGTGGGWFFLSAFTPIGPAAVNGVTFSSDIQDNGTDTSWGSNSLAADGLPATPWTADLYSVGTDTYTPVVSNGGAATYPTITSAGGSQRAVYFQGHWASILPAHAVIPSSAGHFPPAPKQSWATGDQWTSNWANGPAGIGDVLNFLNCPPCLRVDSGSTTTSVPNTTATVIKLTNVGLDTWSAFNTSTWTWTCPADGLYLVFAANVLAAETMSSQVSARVNGTDYWGPSNYCSGTFAGTAAKAQVFSLLAGDTVQAAGYQDSGGTIATLTSHKPRLVILWVGSPGVPGLVNSNPYFSQGSLTGWNGFGGSLTAQQQGTAGGPYPWCVLFTPNSTQSSASAEESSAPFTATPGAWYGVSAWVNPSGTYQTLLGFDWLNSGTYVSTTAASISAGTGSWSLVHTIQQAPASGITSGYPRVGRTTGGTATVPSTATVYIGGVQAGQAGGTQPTPPDLTYRYAAGTPAGSVASVFSEYLANDLTFLTWRPYLLSYQANSQTITDNFSTQVNMDTITGIVHGDYGANYAGWTGGTVNTWTAPVNGWYLICAEIFTGSNAAASYPMVQAGIQVSTGSGHFDFYELHVVPASPAADRCGATALGYYYLREGDSVWPGVAVENYPSSTSTIVTAGHQSHFEAVWCSE